MLLEPLAANGEWNHVLAATKQHADDTPLPVLAPYNSKTKIGGVWIYVPYDRPSGDTTVPGDSEDKARSAARC